jgi:hypothetical protein
VTVKSAIFAVTITLFGVANAGTPKSDDIPTVLIGTGGFSCGKFVEYEQKPNNELQMDLVVQWVWGYLVAYNSRGIFDARIGRAVNQVALPDSPTVLLYLKQFCDKYPLSYVANGTTALLKELGGRVVWNP